MGHAGLVLGLAVGSASDRLKPGFGIEIGFKLHRYVELDLQGAFARKFGTSPRDTIPLLLKLNATTGQVWKGLSLFAGPQGGLVIYIENVGGQAVQMNVGAFGMQAGGSVRLRQNFVLRFEVSWLHALRTTAKLSSGSTFIISAADTVLVQFVFALPLLG